MAEGKKKGKKKKSEEKPFEFFRESSEKNFIEIPFDKIFGRDIGHLNQFNMKRKKTFCNIIPLINEYNNIIIRADKDKEIIFAYLAIKSKIDRNQYKDTDDFITDLYATLYTKKYLTIISDYVEKTYPFDLDSNQSNKFCEGLQFKDIHCKLLNKISMSLKFIIPLVVHYASTSSEIDNLNDYFSKAFDKTFTSFDKDIDIVTKLFESVRSRVIVTKYSDSVFWKYSEVTGYTIDQMTEELTKKLLIDIVPKYTIDKNIVPFNHVVINNNIEYAFHFNFPLNFKPLNLTEPDNNDLSDFDKFSTNKARIDESKVIMHKMNIKLTTEYILSLYKISVSKEEIEYFKKNFQMNKLQKTLISLFFAKYFGTCESIYSCSFEDYTKLMIMMKKILAKYNFKYLQLIVSSKIDAINERKSINKKHYLKIVDNDRFKAIMKVKYPNAISNIVDSNTITKLAGTILNNKFMQNEFGEKETNNKEIKFSSDIMSDEILRFIEMI